MKPFSQPIPRVRRDRRDDRYQAGHPSPPKRAESGYVVAVQDDTVTVDILDEQLTGVIPLGEMPPVGAICEVESRNDLLVIPLWYPGPTDPGGYFERVMEDGPLLYWRLGETGSPTTSAMDSSGYGHHGGVGVDTALTRGVDGLLLPDDSNFAAEFGGATVNVGTSGWGDTAYYTAEALVKITNTTANMWVIGHDHFGDVTHLAWRMNVNAGHLQGLMYTAEDPSTLRSVVSGASLTVGVKYHLVVKFDGTAMKVYINGTLAGSLAFTGTTKPSIFNIHAGSNVLGGQPFFGTLDELAFYGFALSDARIAIHSAAAFA